MAYLDLALQERRIYQASTIHLPRPIIHQYLLQVRPQLRPLFNFRWLLQLGICPERPLCCLPYSYNRFRRRGQHTTPRLLDGKSPGRYCTLIDNNACYRILRRYLFHRLYARLWLASVMTCYIIIIILSVWFFFAALGPKHLAHGVSPADGWSWTHFLLFLSLATLTIQLTRSPGCISYLLLSLFQSS